MNSGLFEISKIITRIPCENKLIFVQSNWPCRGWAIAGRIASSKDDWYVISNVISLQGRPVANKQKIYAFIISYTRCSILGFNNFCPY